MKTLCLFSMKTIEGSMRIVFAYWLLAVGCCSATIAAPQAGAKQPAVPKPSRQAGKDAATPRVSGKACPKNMKVSAVVLNGIRIGAISYEMSGNLSSAKLASKQPDEVYVFTSISEDRIQRAKELGIRAGAAYTRTPSGAYRYLCDIDSKLDSNQILEMFGVQIKPLKPAAPKPLENVFFYADPSAAAKLDQIQSSRILDNETMLKNKIAEMSQSGKKHFLPILDVIFADIAPFILASTGGNSGTPPKTAQGLPADTNLWKMAFVVLRDGDKALLAANRFRRIVGFSELDRTDAKIGKALDDLQKSSLANAAVLIVGNDYRGDQMAGYQLSRAMTEAAEGLADTGFSPKEGSAIFPNRVPNYLIGNDDGFTMAELLNSFRNPEYGRLADLIDAEKRAKAGQEDLPAGQKQEFLFVRTTKHAPVELDQRDLEQIASSRNSEVDEIYRVVLLTKTGAEITFGGLSAVNKDFMKSAKEAWNGVIGLSSKNGFTIAVRYRKDNQTISVSGDEIFHDASKVQDMLPASVVRMIQLAYRE
ncbi:MAG: hypothetical protein JXA73_07765 [Acidobacteria bacterium]|nr:hypothetical protein [Acidobacteriota bacterium]